MKIQLHKFRVQLLLCDSGSPQDEPQGCRPKIHLASSHIDGEVWVIAGSVFISGKPTQWIGEADKIESLVPIPDALFKITVTPIGVLAYLYPQDHPDFSDNEHKQFQTTVNRIQQITGLEFPL